MAFEYCAEDMYGGQIYPGDVITYPRRQGARLWMTEALVTEIIQETEEVRPGKSQAYYKLKGIVLDRVGKSKPIMITCIHRVLLVPRHANSYTVERLRKWWSASRKEAR